MGRQRRRTTPSLQRPVSVDRFLAEFRALWGVVLRRRDLKCNRRARVLAAEGRPRVHLDERMARINRRNTRRYAEHDVGTSDFYFAPAVLSLPRANRIGLIAHEIGHFILRDGPHSEADADQAAREVLGVRIRYDRRWPGKGLQTAGPRGPQGS